MPALHFTKHVAFILGVGKDLRYYVTLVYFAFANFEKRRELYMNNITQLN